MLIYQASQMNLYTTISMYKFEIVRQIQCIHKKLSIIYRLSLLGLILRIRKSNSVRLKNQLFRGNNTVGARVENTNSCLDCSYQKVQRISSYLQKGLMGNGYLVGNRQCNAKPWDCVIFQAVHSVLLA